MTTSRNKLGRQEQRNNSFVSCFSYILQAEPHPHGGISPHHRPRGRVVLGNPNSHQNIYPKIRLVNTCQNTQKNHLKPFLGFFFAGMYFNLSAKDNGQQRGNKHAIIVQFLCRNRAAGQKSAQANTRENGSFLIVGNSVVMRFLVLEY